MLQWMTGLSNLCRDNSSNGGETSHQPTEGLEVLVVGSAEEEMLPSQQLRERTHRVRFNHLLVSSWVASNVSQQTPNQTTTTSALQPWACDCFASLQDGLCCIAPNKKKLVKVCSFF